LQINKTKNEKRKTKNEKNLENFTKYQKNNYNIYINYNMPQMKMGMYFSNGNLTARQYAAATNSSNVTVTTRKSSSALNAPIIGRIHSVKPGCSSCGK
jgi:hypothetical protein